MNNKNIQQEQNTTTATTRLFSVFNPPIKNVIPYKEVTAHDVYTVLISNKYKAVTEKLRASDSQVQKIKTTELSYVTFSGIFTKREAAGLIKHSGLICIDLDHLADVASVKEQVLKEFIPALMFVSPSGDGLKVVYLINLTEGTHIEYFEALQGYFKQQLGVSVDKGCKDVTRACFLPYDPNCHYSNTPAILDKAFIDTFTGAVVPVLATVEHPVLTDHDEIFRRLKIWVEKTHTFTKGSRNTYMVKLTGGLNRYGVPETVALDKLKSYEETGHDHSDDNYTYSEIEATVRSIYRNSTNFNTAGFEAVSNPETASLAVVKEEQVEPTPLLPIDGLPVVLQNIIIECTQVYGTHRDFWAGSILAATALGIGQTHQVVSKYSNSAVLWLAIVAPSGIGKTQPLHFAFSPFHKLDYDALKQYEALVTEYERIKGMSKSERDNEGIVVPVVPVCKQYILADATPEAVVKANQTNTRGITIERDELHGWMLDFGRYSKSGEVQNWLSAWSQQPMTVNRKGSSPIKIVNPFINVTGGLQPEIIPELAKDHRAVNGFMHRFCFVYPDNTQRPGYRSDTVSDGIITAYNTYISHLLALTGDGAPVALSLDAQLLYEAFVNKNSALFNNENSDYIKALYGKLDVICLRLALIIHFAKWACTGVQETATTPDTMKAAIDITEYFRITGLKVFRKLTVPHTGLDKKTVASYLHTLGASQNEIAAALKVSQPYVNKILKGK